MLATEWIGSKALFILFRQIKITITDLRTGYPQFSALTRRNALPVFIHDIMLESMHHTADGIGGLFILNIPVTDDSAALTGSIDTLYPVRFLPKIMHRFATYQQHTQRTFLIAIHIFARHMRRKKGHCNAVFTVIARNCMNILANLIWNEMQRHPKRQPNHNIAYRSDEHQAGKATVLIIASETDITKVCRHRCQIRLTQQYTLGVAR